MIILGIESSCDDTSVALVEAIAPTSPASGHPSLPRRQAGSGRRGVFRILAEKTASQIDVHKKYGGVVPEIAGRCHAENILPLIEEVLDLSAPVGGTSPHAYRQAGYQGEGSVIPDVIAVTTGPGLITGLIVGVEAAKTLSYLWGVPVVGVNHIEGHIHSVEILNPKLETLNKFKYPALTLIASGGHTELILMNRQDKYERIGATLDDAAGECFDKVAKLLGFDYPGGPKISQFAKTGNPNAIKFPRPMLKSDDFNFSFAGLKTSALYWLRDNAKKNGMCYVLRDTCKKDFCASFEQAIIDVLVAKTLKAAEKYKPKTIILGGGVAANQKLRETLSNTIKQHSQISNIQYPISNYCMDNAAMIAIAGYYHAIKKDFTPWQKLKADPNWEIAH